MPKMLINDRWTGGFLSVYVDEAHETLLGIPNFYRIRAAVNHELVFRGYYSPDIGKILADGAGDWCSDVFFESRPFDRLSPYGDSILCAIEHTCRHHLRTVGPVV
jgi:hypothetical protein